MSYLPYCTLLGNQLTSNSGLIGTPINGQILQAFSYLGISLFSGLAMLIGMIILAIARSQVDSRILARV